MTCWLAKRTLLLPLLLGAAGGVFRDSPWGGPFFLASLAYALRKEGAAPGWALGFALWEALPYGVAGYPYGLLGILTALAVLLFAWGGLALPLMAPRGLPRAGALLLAEIVKLELLEVPIGLLEPGAGGTPLGLSARLLGSYAPLLAILLLALALGRSRWALLLMPLALPLPKGLAEPVAPLRAVVVQAASTPEEKYAQDLGLTYLKLTPPTGVLVLWPETATRIPPSLPYWLGGVGTGRTNAAVLVVNGREVSRRAKAFLIPGVERLPGRLVRMRDLLYRKAGVPVPEGFDLERGQLVPLGPFGVLICYEGSLPKATAALAHQGAQVLVELSNESMFDGTPLKARRLKEAQLKAAETGLFYLKASESGPSYAIDRLGRLLARTPEGARGHWTLPYALSPLGSSSWGVRYRGPLLALTFLAGVAMLSVAFPLKRRMWLPKGKGSAL